MSQTAKSKIVYFALYDGVQILDVTGPAEVFSEANREAGYTVYDIRYASNAPDGVVSSSVGLGLATKPLPKRLMNFHTLAIPGAEAKAIEKVLGDEDFMTWLGNAAKKADRLASICSGAFMLGQLGLLDGRRATTHWMGLEQLQRDNPECKVEHDILYTQDGNLWTSAGVLSGVDMALAIVTQDLSATVALKIARNLVIYLVRDGGQSQFSGPIDFQTKANRSELLSLVAWLEDQLKNHITVEQMAEHMATSVRTVHRHCQNVFDLTPAQLLSELRLERSRNLLHQPDLSVKVIAYECGFSNASSYSKAFSGRFGVSPMRYRKTFQEPARINVSLH
ncbi:MAG: GlxA family transcriptional regulator [Candidatus Hydrogenedentota bacterium]